MNLLRTAQYNWKTTRQLLRDRCKHQQEWYLRRHWRYFYTFKAIVCIWPGWENATADQFDDIAGVCCTSSGVDYPPSEPTVHWWTYIVVGRGVFRRWYAYETGDSD